MSNYTFSSLVTSIHHSLHSILCPAVRVALENANLITLLPCLKSPMAPQVSGKSPNSSVCHKAPKGPVRLSHSPPFFWSSSAPPSHWPPRCLLLSASGLLHTQLPSSPPLLDFPGQGPHSLYQAAAMSLSGRNVP